jgi:hypothetical protein
MSSIRDDIDALCVEWLWSGDPMREPDPKFREDVMAIARKFAEKAIVMALQDSDVMCAYDPYRVAETAVALAERDE